MARPKLTTFQKLFARQGLFLVIAAGVLLAATSLIQTYFSKNALKKEAARRAESELTITALKIDNVTSAVETATRNIAWISSYTLAEPDSLFAVLKLLLDNNPLINDCAIGFLPDYYPDKGHWFEPMLRRSGDTLERVVIGSETHDYFNAPWYTEPLKTGRPYWSEPYYDDEGAGSMVITCSTPVRDTEGNIVGVFGSDITLDWITDMIENIRIYPSSFSKMTSSEGHLIASPAETLTTGNIFRYDTVIDRTGWKMEIVIPEAEIYRDVRKNTFLVNILQILGLVLIILILRRTALGQMRLEKSEAAKERIQNEVHIASEIQKAMVPRTFPPFPERSDIDLSASLVPAKEVGGDLYDFFIRDEKLYFAIGDVSGKGIPASLVMAVTRSMFRTVSGHETNPGVIMKVMNDSLSDGNESSMFVTFFVGVLDLHTGHLRYCNAGHNGPLILTDTIRELPVVPNLPLGIMPGMDFEVQETDMQYDDALFLYTDGLNEAEDISHSQFGMERAVEVLGTRRDSAGHLEALKAAVAEFVGEAPQSDDLTMMFIHYLARVDRRHIVLHNDIQQIPALTDFVGQIAGDKGLDESLSMSLKLALEEAVTNVMLYAYPKGRDGLIDVLAAAGESSLAFIITDSGKPFDPTAKAEPDITLDVEDRPIGGLGIFMVSQIMDSVRYERVDSKNVLKLTKKI